MRESERILGMVRNGPSSLNMGRISGHAGTASRALKPVFATIYWKKNRTVSVGETMQAEAALGNICPLTL